MQPQELRDVYLRPSELPWIPFAEGIRFRLLRASSESGTWTVLFHCAAGSAFASHQHLGAGEYLMLRGRMEVRGGRDAGGVTAEAGDYGYEPSGVVHDATSFPEETEFYFTNHGAVAFLDEQGNATSILDWQVLRDLAKSAAT